MNDPNTETRPGEALLKNNQNVPTAVGKYTKENKTAPLQPKLSNKFSKPLAVASMSPTLKLDIIDDTNNIKGNFLNEMLSYELSKSPEALRTDFLKRHRITPEIRARMVSLAG